jgi:outer membrane protein assembly factor BamE (lipoprotein component of BamABCDE complex)
MKKLISLIAACALVAGCAATGVKVTDEDLAFLRTGETTESEVVERLGPPTTRMKLGDGSTFMMYTYAEYSTRASTFIPIVGAFVGGADTKSSHVTLRFDKSGKLIDSSSSSTNMGTASNLSSGVSSPGGDVQQPRKAGDK